MTGTGGRARRKGLLFGVGSLVVLMLFGLGVWQVQRLAWKNALIARVEAGLSAAPVPAPGPAAWPALSFDTDEYRRVTATGRYLPVPDILVQAVTVRGSGFWVLAPFETDDGFRLFVNRGFVPSDRRAPADRPLPEGEQTVRGLLRLTQPNGAFLRSNDPADRRWFSRDTAAMGAALGIGAVAPYFIDADKAVDGGQLPIGGLTVVSFPNNHLGYAITWFALSGGLAFLLLRVRRQLD
ncbi:surfeit locus 1 family protein [Rhizobium sp. RU20A]|uniref:SURF1 family protein n=1 Tax=Rhizobium sp. RU20A TaxID=1907412 RepID=UPI000954C0FE|nr:SURF1 family protein [Rhizobium sp. RU20A]SIR45026.1 surfeit locus 1 family protein [Rhizobium sp. RU20A]